MKIESAISLAALCAGTLALTSCAESKLVEEDVNEDARRALQRFKPIIGEKALEELTSVEFGSRLEYKSSLIGGRTMNFFIEEGHVPPEPSQLDAVAGFIKQKTKELSHVSWRPTSRTYFVTTLDYLPASHRYAAFSNTRPYDAQSRADGVDYLYVEFCQGLLSYHDDFFGIGVDAQESLCNEVGIAAHSAKSGLSYEEYQELHDELRFPLRGRNIPRSPFSNAEYDFFRGVFGSEKILMSQELRDLSLGVAQVAYSDSKYGSKIEGYLVELDSKGVLPTEFPQALEALNYYAYQASAGNFV